MVCACSINAKLPITRAETEKHNSNHQKICTENCGKPFGCPEIKCTSRDVPEINRNCPIPDCLSPLASWLLWPVSSDPLSFWQCPHIGIWSPIKKDCGCETLFDYRQQRCVHPHEWSLQCFNHQPNPIPKECPICNSCGGGDIPVEPSTLPSIPTAPTREPTTVPPFCPCNSMLCSTWSLCPPKLN